MGIDILTSSSSSSSNNNSNNKLDSFFVFIAYVDNQNWSGVMCRL